MSDPQSLRAAESLHVVERKGDASRTLVLAHGFTQNANCWGLLDDALAPATRRLVDLPGHGQSQHDDVSLPEAAELVGAAGGRAIYIGYSMGGRIVLHLALQRPELVEALILIGATAGITDSQARIDRLNDDCALAESMEQLSTEQFIDQWLQHPLFARLTDEQSCRVQRLSNRIAGLAATLVHRGTGAMRPLHDDLATLNIPVLILAGAEDPKFVDLGAELKNMIGTNATCMLIPGAGHACHLEAPAATAEVINNWLSSL